MKQIPIDIVRHLFTYDSGTLVWKNCSKPKRNGSFAGFICKKRDLGYESMHVRIPGRGDYQYSRIIWTVYYGVDPFPFEIDHIDQNPLNNNIDNLRLAEHAENCRNRKDPLPNNLAGIKGVGARKNGKFSARITRNYKTVHLGYFNTKDEAAEAYKNASVEFHGEFASY